MTAERRVRASSRAFVPDDLRERLVALRRDLHRNPELSFAEHRTSDVLARLDSATRFGHHDARFTTIAGRVAARLWEAGGDPRRALAALRRRVRGTGANHHESAWQREVGRLAALVGDREAAIRAYRIYLIRRSNADAVLFANATTTGMASDVMRALRRVT